jgi:nitrate reductase (NAD(P)H)
MMPDYHIGSLDEGSKKLLLEGEIKRVDTGPRPIFLDSRAWTKAPLHAKRSVSWDCRIFTFKLEHDEQVFGLPTGQHVMLRIKDPETKENVIRSYTPISETNEKGSLDVLVKIYFDTKERKGGKMTKALDAIAIGEEIEFKGPIGKFQYHGKGLCSVNGNQRVIKHFYMICGGSGVTPIYQVFRAVMQDKDDPTNCVVLNGNRQEEDILCREELDYFAKSNPTKCKLLHTLTQGSKHWTGLRGRISASLLRENCERKEGCMVLICGPGTMEKAAHASLKELGWQDEDILFF